MKSLIHQLKSYGFDNLKIEIFANAIYDDIDKNVLINLSRKRANIFRDMLILEGFSLHNIYIHQNGDSAPIIIGNEKLNNRIDIVVKKFKN
jgi:chitinase